MSHRTSHPFSRTALATVLVVATAAPPARSEQNNPDLAGVSPAVASSAVLAPGQRVRVTAAAPAFTGITVGNLVKIGPDNLTLVDAEGGVVLELPRTWITRVEVSHQRRTTKKGLLIGLGFGAATSAIVFALPEDEPLACGGSLDEPSHPCTSGEKAAIAVSKPSARDLTWQVSPTLSRGGRGADLRLQLTW